MSGRVWLDPVEAYDRIAPVYARLAERHIEIELTPAARERLIQVGYDPAFGARPLKRAIQKELETPLARKIVAGDVRDGSRIKVDAGDGGLVFEAKETQKAARR